MENTILLFNKLNIKFSKRTKLNNIVESLNALYPDYKRFNSIDATNNTIKDNNQLFRLLFTYIIIHSKNNYKYLQSDSYLMALSRQLICRRKNEDELHNNIEIETAIYLLFKTLLKKKYFSKFFFADEEFWIGQYFFKWSIFNILIEKRPDLFEYYWKKQHTIHNDSNALINFKYIIENTIFGLISMSPPFINNFETLDITETIYKHLLKTNIQTIFAYYAAYCIEYLPKDYQITNPDNITNNIKLFSAHTSTSWSEKNIFNNQLPNKEILDYTKEYFSEENFNNMKNTFHEYTTIYTKNGDSELLLIPFYKYNPHTNIILSYLSPLTYILY